MGRGQVGKETLTHRQISRMITTVERGGTAAAAIMSDLDSLTGKAYIVGVTGPPGAGKSTLVRALAKRLDRPFIQLNQFVEEAAGMSQGEIFDLLGQAAFRRLERQCLDQVIASTNSAVIETGGGIIAEIGTFERLLSACHTIWLQASPE